MDKNDLCLVSKAKSKSKSKSKQPNNHCKRVLEAVKVANVTKIKESVTSLKLHCCDVWRIANSVFKKGKSVIPPLFDGPEVTSSASDKAKVFPKIIFKNSNLNDSGFFLHAFLSRTNFMLLNMSLTSKMFKMIITNSDYSITFGPDCIPVVDPKNSELELSYVLVDLFSIC